MNFISLVNQRDVLLGERAGEREPVESPMCSLNECGRLAIVWICCVMAAGILPGQTVFASMLASAGVFGDCCDGGSYPCAGQLDAVGAALSSSACVAMVMQLPAGLLFDRYGGNWIGVFGARIVAAGILLVTMTVFSAQLGTDSLTSWVLPIGATIMEAGSTLNSFAFFSLVFHYPASPTVILSLAASTYQMSSVVPCMLQVLMDFTSIQFGYALLFLVLCVLVSAWALTKTLPTLDEYYTRAQAVLGVPVLKLDQTVSPVRRTYEAWLVVTTDMRDHMLLFAGVAFGASFTGLYTNMSFAYGKDLFASEDWGMYLADMQAGVSVVVVVVVGPVAGKLADLLGLHRFSILLTFCLATALAFFAVATWWAVWITMVSGTCYFTLWQIFQSRYVLAYAPPNRLGAYACVFGLFMSVFILPFLVATYSLILIISDGPNAFFLPFLVTGILGLAGNVAFNVLFGFAHGGHGVPTLPHMLPEDELELSSIFGAIRLSEAAEIVRLSKEQLCKDLVDPSSQKCMELLGRIDVETFERVFDRHGADDTIALLESRSQDRFKFPLMMPPPHIWLPLPSEPPLSPSRSPSSSEPNSPRSPQEAGFTIHVELGSATDLAIASISDGTCGLKITNVDDGPIQVWNQQHEDQAVHVKDIIVQVNGIRGTPQRLRDAIRRGKQRRKGLVLKIVREVSDDPDTWERRGEILGKEMRELFRNPASDIEGRLSKFTGDLRMLDDRIRWRAFGVCLFTMIQEKDSEGVELYMLEMPVVDQCHGMLDMAEWTSDAERQHFDQQLKELIPDKVRAELMRRRPCLKDIVRLMLKSEMQRDVDRCRHLWVDRRIVSL